jgi:hypothetical protein
MPPRTGNLVRVGGLTRCVSCGEVHWNLRLSARTDAVQQCRLCGADLRAEPRTAGGRFGRLKAVRRDERLPGEAAPLGPRAAS